MKALLFTALMLTTTLSAAVTSEDYDGWYLESSLPGVVYYWHTVNGPDADLVGRLEVTTEAYLSGAVNYAFNTHEHDEPGEPQFDATAPVLSIQFGFADDLPRQTGNRYRETPTGVEDAANSGFSFTFGSLLTGGFGTGGNSTHLQMSSQGSLCYGKSRATLISRSSQSTYASHSVRSAKTLPVYGCWTVPRCRCQFPAHFSLRALASYSFAVS